MTKEGWPSPVVRRSLNSLNLSDLLKCSFTYQSILRERQAKICLPVFMDRDAVFSLTLFIIFYILVYLCDFAKRCPLSFRLNTGDARVQASVAGKKPGGLASCLVGVSREHRHRPIRGWVASLFCVKTRGVGRGGFVTLIRVLCQKAVQSQIIFPVA